MRWLSLLWLKGIWYSRLRNIDPKTSQATILQRQYIKTQKFRQEKVLAKVQAKFNPPNMGAPPKFFVVEIIPENPAEIIDT